MFNGCTFNRNRLILRKQLIFIINTLTWQLVDHCFKQIFECNRIISCLVGQDFTMAPNYVKLEEKKKSRDSVFKKLLRYIFVKVILFDVCKLLNK